MHELSLTETLADLVEERTTGRTVVSVRLRVGPEAGVMVEAVTFCWDVVTAGTRLEGSRLEIEDSDGADLTLVSVELRREEPCAPPAAVETPPAPPVTPSS
jgi:Zn finger protein HypA/HybF involved in hydrogenase expression